MSKFEDIAQQFATDETVLSARPETHARRILRQIREKETVKSESVSSDDLEEYLELENSEFKAKAARLSEFVKTSQMRITEYSDNLKGRNSFGTIIKFIMCGWLGSVIAMCFMHGFRIWNFYLDKEVLIALLTSGTAGVLGLPLIMAKFYFSKDGKLAPEMVQPPADNG